MVKKIILTVFLGILVLTTISCRTKPTMNFKIDGINKDLLEKVTTRLQSKQQSMVIYNQKTIAEFYQEVPEEISKELKLQGYFNSAIEPEGELTYKNRKWNENFSVSLKSPVKIKSIDLQILGEGSKHENFADYASIFPLKTGDIFQTDSYNRAKQRLFDLADAHGYPKAFLEVKEVKVNLENNTADIILHFNTGPQYFFGKTMFTVKYLSHSFLSKFLPYKPGEIYTSEKLYALQENLSNSNFFESVAINSQIADSQSQDVPVEVTLIPRKRKQYSAGIGFGTDTGVRASLGMQLRNITPYGHSFKSSIQASQVHNELELHYLIPGKNPVTDLYDFSVSGKTINYDKGKSRIGQAGVGYITSLGNWQRSMGINLQTERYQLEGLPYENSFLLMPSFTLTHSKSDDPLKPTNGHRIGINVQGALKYLLATDNFVQVRLDAKYIRQILPRIQIVLRGELGYTAIDQINDLPLSLQFYTGGTQSIRGFGYNTIGPGHNLMVGSAELRFTVYKDWYIATFYDAGNANNDILKKMNQAVGVGIGIQTGVGNLELTFAKAISQPGTPGRIQFNLDVL